MRFCALQPMSMKRKSVSIDKPGFIPDAYSPVFNRVFYWYCLWLFRHRFQCVWLDDSAIIVEGGNHQSKYRLRANSTLYLGNHNSWWDGLVPLLLNEKIFRKRARAMMDEDQLKKIPFFRKLGTFSINRRHPRKALKSLAYAAGLLNDAPPGKGIGLWVYPEGKLVAAETPIAIESGIPRLIRQLDLSKTDILPFAIHMHTMRGDKPELFVMLGKPVQPDICLTDSFRSDAAQLLENLRASCRRESSQFDETGKPAGGFRLICGRMP